MDDLEKLKEQIRKIIFDDPDRMECSALLSCLKKIRDLIK